MRFVDAKQAVNVAISITLAIILAWTGAAYYVFSNWESGETIDIELGHNVKFRTWIVDTADGQLAIYDAPPEIISLVAESRQATLTRGQQSFQTTLSAEPTQLDSEELNAVLSLYNTKYSEQTTATNIYYLLIGPRRGSQLFILNFGSSPAAG